MGRFQQPSRFPPPILPLRELDLAELERRWQKKLFYAPAGRWALAKILQSIPLTTGEEKIIAIPSYICETVHAGIRKAGWNWVEFDVDRADLNPSLASAIEFFSRQKFRAILVPSLYGNPADLENFESWAREKKIFMIDDAAQSFGARLNERWVGTFGDAGFFSFAPGKATAAHCGCFFWSSGKISSTNIYAKKILGFFLKTLFLADFKINRLKRKPTIFSKCYGEFLAHLRGFLCSRLDWSDLPLFSFERKWLGAAVSGVDAETTTWQREAWNILEKSLEKKISFIKSLRGHSQKFKAVIQCKDLMVAEKLKTGLRNAGFFAAPGYAKIPTVVELPLSENLDEVRQMAVLAGELVS